MEGGSQGTRYRHSHGHNEDCRTLSTTPMGQFGVARRFELMWWFGQGGVGHRFPAGTIDAFDLWLELKATDENGKVIFWSGRIEAEDGNGPVDPGAHFYRAYMLDEHGNLINKRNAWAARTVLYANTIPPGAADTVHYRLFIPPDCGDEIQLHAKLNYRKFNWWHTQWAYAGSARSGGYRFSGRQRLRRRALGLHRRYIGGRRADQGNSQSPNRPHGRG